MIQFFTNVKSFCILTSNQARAHRGTIIKVSLLVLLSLFFASSGLTINFLGEKISSQTFASFAKRMTTSAALYSVSVIVPGGIILIAIFYYRKKSISKLVIPVEIVIENEIDILHEIQQVEIIVKDKAGTDPSNQINNVLIVNLLDKYQQMMRLDSEYQSMIKNEYSDLLKTKYSEKMQTIEDFRSAGQDLYLIFLQTKILSSDRTKIDLDELSEMMNVSVDQLKQLFDEFRLSEPVFSDVGCLNAFFCILADYPDNNNTLGMNTYYSFGHPLWPGDKIPSQNVLAISDFALFLGIDEETCIETLRITDYDQNGIVTIQQMREVCLHLSRGENAAKFKPTRLPTLFPKMPSDYSSPWTTERQKNLRPSFLES